MAEQNDEDNMNILFPTGFNQSNGECTVLVQIDPNDSSTLDFTGATGAIGRLEADDIGGTCIMAFLFLGLFDTNCLYAVIFDFKGVQYRGTFYPTASAVVLAVVNGKENYLKIDGLADDFCYLEKTGDALKKFDAQAVGDMSGYNVQDEDVNRNVFVSRDSKTEDALLQPEHTSKSETLKGKRLTSKKSILGSAPKKMKQKS